MKKLILATALSLGALTGCSALEHVGQYSRENPLVVNAATRQAVFRYIDAGETETDKSNRAKSVIDAVREVDAFLEGNPTASIGALLQVIDAQIKWDKLNPADRLLIKDIVTMVGMSLEDKLKAGLLSEDAVIGLRALFDTAITTAMLL